MASFYFRVLDGNEAYAIESPYEFIDVDGAASAARDTLADMALDGLPPEPMNMYAVEVLDQYRNPILEVRLSLEVIPKT